MQNIQDNQFKQMWKKEYSVISQAYERVKQDNGGYLPFDASASPGNTVLLAINLYVKKVADCGGSSNNICGTNPAISANYAIKTLYGDYMDRGNLTYNQFISKDGANFYGRGRSSTDVIIFVDVNGYAKGPNVLGKDIFGATMNNTKIAPLGAQGTGLENTCNSTWVNCSLSAGLGSTGCAGAGCSMEYLSQ